MAEVHLSFLPQIVDSGDQRKIKEVTAALKAMHACEGVKAVREKATAAEEKLSRRKLFQAASRVADSIEEIFCSLDFPREHWRSLRTNNPLVRRIKEVRRCTRVVGAFPSGRSAIMLVCGCSRHVAGTKWELRCHLDIGRLRERDRDEHHKRRQLG